jgi:hypothetical protein
MMRDVLDSDWGRLFRNWESVQPSFDVAQPPSAGLAYGAQPPAGARPPPAANTPSLEGRGQGEGRGPNAAGRRKKAELTHPTTAGTTANGDLAIGYPDVGRDAAEIKRTGFAAFSRSLGILGTCIAQNPDVGKKRRRVASAS